MSIFKELPVLSIYDVAPEDEARPINPAKAREILAKRKPDWLRIRPPGGENYTKIKGMLRERKLHTVCEEAHCPNVAECWAGGTATFMIGGDTCTRACRFCAIKTARRPPPLDPLEPMHIAESVATLGLKYVVLTSVDRDDMADGGANHFAETIRGIKRLNPNIIVEALVSDFQGDVEAVRIIVESGLDVYAHNVETTKRLQYQVRDPRAGYLQSLSTLRAAKNIARERGQPLVTKTSIMLGLGETKPELSEAFADLREFEVDVLTLGQYLRPSMNHLPVDSFYTPEEYTELGKEAETYGFLYVASGAMVRSSYKAGEFFIKGMIEKSRAQLGTDTYLEAVNPITKVNTHGT